MVVHHRGVRCLHLADRVLQLLRLDRRRLSPRVQGRCHQSWYDWAWFAFLLGWIYLSIEMAATGVVELMDDRPRPMIPRWFTWLTLAGALSIITAAGPAFFKSGPFAYHGLLAFYMPVVVGRQHLRYDVVHAPGTQAFRRPAEPVASVA